MVEERIDPGSDAEDLGGLGRGDLDLGPVPEEVVEQDSDQGPETTE